MVPTNEESNIMESLSAKSNNAFNYGPISGDLYRFHNGRLASVARCHLLQEGDFVINSAVLVRSLECQPRSNNRVKPFAITARFGDANAFI